jgi:hypothetical protein
LPDFNGPWYQNWKKCTKWHKMYKIVKKYPKCP